MGDFQELSDLLHGLFAASPGAADVDPAELGITLQAFRDRFLNLLSYPVGRRPSLGLAAPLTVFRARVQSVRRPVATHRRAQGPNQASRQQVEALLVTTPKYDEQRLDAEPDKRMVRSTDRPRTHRPRSSTSRTRRAIATSTGPRWCPAPPCAKRRRLCAPPGAPRTRHASPHAGAAAQRCAAPGRGALRPVPAHRLRRGASISRGMRAQRDADGHTHKRTLCGACSTGASRPSPRRACT